VAIAAAMKGMTPPQLWKAMPQGNCFVGSQDTLLNSAYRDRGNNSRDLCLRQPQIICCLHPHFVQNAIELWTGLISAVGDLLLMASPLPPLRKINHWETTMESQLPGPTNKAAMTLKPAQNPSSVFKIFNEPPQETLNWISVPPPKLN
jgi:hypothetical protein